MDIDIQYEEDINVHLKEFDAKKYFPDVRRTLLK